MQNEEIVPLNRPSESSNLSSVNQNSQIQSGKVLFQKRLRDNYPTKQIIRYSIPFLVLNLIQLLLHIVFDDPDFEFLFDPKSIYTSKFTDRLVVACLFFNILYSGLAIFSSKKIKLKIYLILYFGKKFLFFSSIYKKIFFPTNFNNTSYMFIFCIISLPCGFNVPSVYCSNI